MKICKFKLHQNVSRITDALHEGVSTFMTISGCIILRIKNISGTFVEEIKTHILCSVTFSENRAVYEIMWKK